LSFQGLFRRGTIGLLLALAALACVPAVASAATGGIKGTVTSAKAPHSPIDRVLVCAFRTSGLVEEGEEEAEGGCARTAFDGSYQLGGLIPGEYIVEFWPGAANYVFEFWNDETEFSSADPVTVLGGAFTAGIDAELTPGSGIEGQARAPGGEPLAEVKVCVLTEEGEPAAECTETDGEGDYLVPRLAAGEYKVFFTPFYTGLNLLDQFWDHEPSWEFADTISLGAEETKTGIDADFEVGAEIRGTVRSASTGQPLSEILACAIEASTGEAFICAFTRANGGYTIPSVPAGLFKVGFSQLPSEVPFMAELGYEGDGYPTQFYNGKPTLAAADTLTTKPPGVLTEIDASLGTPPLVPPVVPIAKPKAKRCKHGFRKKRVKGKVRCVKVHRHKRHRSRGAQALTAGFGPTENVAAIDRRLLARRAR
jgi:hypothetical protein